MITLKNEVLEVTLANKGAEIIKIVGQDDQINYMWRRDPIQWANSAPILFPIVGALQNNECRIDGKTYTMTQHGFSRHSEYEANQINDQEVVFTLISNEEIAKQYPYLFKLDVTYKLDLLNAPVESIARFFDPNRPKFNPISAIISLFRKKF